MTIDRWQVNMRGSYSYKYTLQVAATGEATWEGHARAREGEYSCTLDDATTREIVGAACDVLEAWELERENWVGRYGAHGIGLELQIVFDDQSQSVVGPVFTEFAPERFAEVAQLADRLTEASGWATDPP